MKISASLLIFNTFFNPALAASEAGEGLAYIRIVQTKEGSRATPFSDLPEIQFKPNKGIDDATALTINPNVQFQTIEGFGGAMTESSAAILDKLPKDLYDEVMDSYFSKNGLGYSFVRVPMGSCDYTPFPSWSYDDVKRGEKGEWRR